MQSFLQATVVGVIAVIFTALLKKNNKELAVLLSLAACVLIAIFLVDLAGPVVSYFSRLQNLAGLDNGLMTPLLKTVGIGILTQICSSVCSDAGENAIGNLIEICGSVLALYVALPLLEAVLEMVQTMCGG